MAVASFLGAFFLHWIHLNDYCISVYDINKPAAQAAGQTLPDATLPVGKTHPFSNLDALQDLDFEKCQ